MAAACASGGITALTAAGSEEASGPKPAVPGKAAVCDAAVAVEETIVRRATAVEETIVRRATALEAEIEKDIVLPLRDTAARFGGYAHFLAYSSESFFSSPERGPFGPIPLDRCSSRLTISEAKSLSLAIAYLWGAS